MPGFNSVSPDDIAADAGEVHKGGGGGAAASDDTKLLGLGNCLWCSVMTIFLVGY